jgi:5'-3' exonuclease
MISNIIMGIPVFFKTLITDYEDLLVSTDKDKRVNDNLYLDLNCAIHPCCSGETDETIMIHKIIHKIDELVKLVKPINEIFIAIDGVAPKAKMIQQRSRRHKSIQQNKVWDTNLISPGTPFMKKLSLKLHEVYSDTKYIISDSDIPGEGEHKILQKIKCAYTMNHVIYGLDADLIMLSLVSLTSDIYLLREKTEYNIENLTGEYIYMNIDSLKTCISSKLPNIPENIAIDDYIFMCFFLGNDFIKNSPSLNLRYNGLDALITIYNSVQRDYHYSFQLINRQNKDILNYEYLKRFIERLEQGETKRLVQMISIRKKQNHRCKRNLSKIIDKSEFNEYKEYNLPILQIQQELHIFKDKDWIHRYNAYLDVDEDTISCEYIKSLIWTAHYYFRECRRWDYAYDYSHAPSLYDLNKYILHNETITLAKCDHIPTIKEQLKFIMPLETLIVLGITEEDYIHFIPSDKHILKRYGWEIH